MSQFIQHPAESLKLSFAVRRAAWLLSLAVLVAAAAVAVALLVSNGDSNSSAAAPAATGVILHSQPASRQREVLPNPQQIRRGVIPGPRPFHGGGFTERFNGGPDEGTAGN